NMPTTTNYIWDEENYLAESDGTNTINVVYTNEPQKYGNLVSTRNSETSSYHHFDALGSTRQLTNAVGHVTDSMSYDALGKVANRTGISAVLLLWIGERGYYFDTEIELLSVRLRKYDPKTGRWRSTDKIEFAEIPNPYAYSQNTPLGRIDPSGELSQVTSFIPILGGFIPAILILPCGAYSWTTQWVLGDPEKKQGNGFIIQRVQFPTTPRPCNPKDNPQPIWNNPGQKCTQGGYGYFEIWRVQPDRQGVPTIYTASVFNDNPSDSFSTDTFALAGYTTPTLGSVVAIGTAFFISDINIRRQGRETRARLESLFKGPPNNVGSAGTLFSVCFTPQINAFVLSLQRAATGKTTKKQATRKWNCCCVNGKSGENTLTIDIDGNSANLTGLKNKCPPPSGV
ncbi:MAG: hypothetical protein JSS02_25300, partial [Planctomycetes bacterium]|nr:hypothetical protein [Planctomycetota bacterium]